MEYSDYDSSDSEAEEEIKMRVLDQFSKNDRELGYEILNEFIVSGDYLAWNDKGKMIIDGRRVRGSNIAELIEYMLNVHDENDTEPCGLTKFIDALKEIEFDSQWLVNENIAHDFEGRNEDVPSDEDEENNDSDSNTGEHVNDERSH